VTKNKIVISHNLENASDLTGLIEARFPPPIRFTCPALPDARGLEGKTIAVNRSRDGGFR
jgi:hypothetical protein